MSSVSRWNNVLHRASHTLGVRFDNHLSGNHSARVGVFETFIDLNAYEEGAGLVVTPSPIRALNLRLQLLGYSFDSHEYVRHLPCAIDPVVKVYQELVMVQKLHFGK